MNQEWNEYYLYNEKRNIRIGVLPSYGGALNRFELKINDHQWVNLIDGYEDVKETEKHRFKGVLLAPFPNRINGGIYTFEGQDFDLEKNDRLGHAIHGFVYNEEFLASDSLQADSNELSLTYKYDGRIKGFPFPFQLNLLYEVLENGFSQTLRIRNIGNQTFPFGLGWHPYFSCLTGMVNGLRLKLSNARKVLVDEVKIPTIETINYPLFEDFHLVGDEELDHCFILKPTNNFDVELYYPSIDRTLQLDFGEENVEKFIQIYTPKDRRTIAIEPMTCAPDVFNNGLGLQRLEKDQIYEWRCRWKIA